MYNNSNNNNWNSSWNSTWNRAMSPLPHYEIIEVNGEAGAKSFRMGPNSSQFLADLTDSHTIWVAQTDGAGYATYTQLDVNVHQNAPAVDVASLETRIKNLEDILNEYVNSGANKQPKKQQQHANANGGSTNNSSST